MTYEKYLDYSREELLEKVRAVMSPKRFNHVLGVERAAIALAEKYAGGGHPLASGATVKNWEELDDLLDDMARVVAEYLRENKIKI